MISQKLKQCLTQGCILKAFKHKYANVLTARNIKSTKLNDNDST